MSSDPPNQLAAPEEEDLYCLDCGYNLRGLPGMSRTCPECGRHNELDPSNVDGAVVERVARRLRYRARGSAIVLPFLAISIAILIATQSLPGLVLLGLTGGIWLSLTFPTADGHENHRDVVRCGVIVIGYQFAVCALCGILFVIVVLSIRKEGLLGSLPLVVRAFVASAALTPAIVILICAISPIANAMRRRFREAAQRMAERWHEERLRTPPERRRPR